MLLLHQLALTASVGKGGRDSELDGVTTRHLIATRFVIILIAVTLREWAADRHLLLVVVVAWNVPMVVSLINYKKSLQNLGRAERQSFIYVKCKL